MQPKHWRLFGALVAALTVVACTPDEVQRWVEWHNVDPVAAEEFANLPAVQARLTERATSSTTRTEPDVRRGDVWDRIAECESGGNWSYDGGSGYDGGLQFLPATWRAYGGREFAPNAYQASRAQQIAVAERVLADAGWRAWPACSRRLGLR